MRFLILVATLPILACSPPAITARVERVVVGDTTVIRTSGDGEWGPVHDAIELKRVGNDSAATTFGQVYSGTALQDGGVVVFDAKPLDATALKHFDADGRFIRSFARVGGGPGEFAPTPAAPVTASHDGVILLLDPGNARIDRYSPSGNTLRGIPIAVPAGGMGQDYIRAGADGSVYVLSFASPVTHNIVRTTDVTAYIHYDSIGRVLDTIPVQQMWSLPTPHSEFDATDEWTVLADGRILITRSDRLGFLVKAAHGDSGMVLTEVLADPPRLDPQERKALQAIADAGYTASKAELGTAAGPQPVVPDHKAAFRRIQVDLEGRIWLQRNVESVKVRPHVVPGDSQFKFDQPVVWSAFQPNGTWLGDIRFPIGTRIVGFVGDVAWAIVRDEDDQQFLVKYRMR